MRRLDAWGDVIRCSCGHPDLDHAIEWGGCLWCGCKEAQ